MRRNLKRHKARVEYQNIYSILLGLKNDDYETLKIEIDKGYDPVYGDGKLSLVHYCVLYNSIRCLTYLLDDAAISPDQFDSVNRGSPLHLAIAQNNYEMAKILIKSGADLTTPNFNGLSPISLLQNQNSED